MLEENADSLSAENFMKSVMRATALNESDLLTAIGTTFALCYGFMGLTMYV